MEITKETINNSEIRLHITISKLKTILLVCLISFTSLLVRQTLQIQHSCNPMIHWSGELPTECQVATTDNLNSSDRQELPSPQQIDNKANINNSKSNFKSFSSKTVSEPETQFDSYPNQITYKPPTPESSQHNTEIESKNLLDSPSNQITYESPTPKSSQHNTEIESKNLLDVIVEKAVAVMNFFWWVIKRNH